MLGKGGIALRTAKKTSYFGKFVTVLQVHDRFLPSLLILVTHLMCFGEGAPSARQKLSGIPYLSYKAVMLMPSPVFSVCHLRASRRVRSSLISGLSLTAFQKKKNGQDTYCSIRYSPLLWQRHPHQVWALFLHGRPGEDVDIHIPPRVSKLIFIETREKRAVGDGG